MISMPSDLFDEIRRFLSVYLIEENLSSFCRLKLIDILSKLEIYQLKKIEENDDYYCYEEPYKLNSSLIDTKLELPIKRIKDKNNNLNITLRGPLYYRYNLQCWEHYPSSLLLDGRLVCSKTFLATDSIDCSSLAGKSSDLSVFLMGYTALSTGKDCGMNFVFKLTHPIEDTKVFATKSEEETIAWIDQINQYSKGSVPTVVKMFQDSPDLLKQQFDDIDDVSRSSIENQSSLVNGDVKKNEIAHLRRQSSDILNVINNSTITNPNFLISDLKFNRSRSSYSFRQANIVTNQNNTQSNNGGSIISHGRGNSIISSMRRKVESIGNKYRNRKSFAGFSSKSFINNGTSANKSKTIPGISNEINRRGSMYSAQFLPGNKDAIFTGIAKLRVQGNRAGWIDRWCQLKPKLLECYHIYSISSKPNLDFALCLEDLVLGLSNDKKHRSALRLSCDNVKQELLFEVQDKVLMGFWIKAFIEALGITNPKQFNSNNYDIPQTSLGKDSEGVVEEEEQIKSSLNTIRSCGSGSIYDEVCLCDSKEIEPPSSMLTSIPKVNSAYQRRWSSPLIELPPRHLQPPVAPYPGRCLRDHPLPSLPASSTDSENNSDSFSETPNENEKNDIESLYDYTLTFNKSLTNSCTDTVKSKLKNPTYPIRENVLRSSIIYADQDPECISERNETDNHVFEFDHNKDHFRQHGCSLADLIDRFESRSESQETSTIGSKTDSSCTPTYQHSSAYNLNSISNSFISMKCIDLIRDTNIRKVTRSFSDDTNIGVLRRSVKNTDRVERSCSLSMKKASFELIFEELSTIKEDMCSLHKQRKELQRVLSEKTVREIESIESLNNIISDVTNEIPSKESRLKELSRFSSRRLTTEDTPIES